MNAVSSRFKTVRVSRCATISKNKNVDHAEPIANQTPQINRTETEGHWSPPSVQAPCPLWHNQPGRLVVYLSIFVSRMVVGIENSGILPFFFVLVARPLGICPFILPLFFLVLLCSLSQDAPLSSLKTSQYPPKAQENLKHLLQISITTLGSLFSRG